VALIGEDPGKVGNQRLISPIPVAEEDLERQIAIARAAAANPLAGLFGPNSMTWRIDRESVVFLGAGRALLLQLAHPFVAAAIGDHSHALEAPILRFHRTFSIIFSIVFGTVEEAMEAARRLHRRHAKVTGFLAAGAGPFASGSCYFANELAALRWVSATLTQSSLLAYELVLPPLCEEERERYWAESQTWSGLFGIPRAALPADWKAFLAYNESMWGSDVLTVTPVARAIADRLLWRSRRFPPIPEWYRALTAWLLPTRLREAFGLRHGLAERARAERALRRIRRVYPMLPESLRFVGPYREAVGRLAGKPRPDLPTRLSNRFWIGRPHLQQASAAAPRARG
jgi:uncharacterized protein (DUF2236 family)